MNRTLLLIGGLDDGVLRAKELGLTVLLVQHPDKLTDVQREAADVVRAVDFTEWSQLEPVVHELHTEHGFAAVVTLTEPGLEPAGRINDRYGLGGTGHEVTQRFRDKGVMRNHLAAVDPGAAVAAAPLDTRADLDAFAASHGYPIIVKPTDATASIGVFRVDSPADADRVWDRVCALRGTRTDRISTLYLLQDFLLEEYVDGPEYSVESFSFAGRHVAVTVTEKFTDPGHFAELGHAVPARVDEATWAELTGCVQRFLDLLEFTDGVCHTEVRLSARGPRVIEGHNRFGGDAITDLVAAAYGVDLTTLAVGWPFRLVPELPDRPQARCGAAARFAVGVPGRVGSVAGVEAALAEDGVLAVRITAKEGDPVGELRDNWDRLGLVAVTGADTTAAIHRGAELIATAIDIQVTGEDGRLHRARAAEIRDDAVVLA